MRTYNAVVLLSVLAIVAFITAIIAQTTWQSLQTLAAARLEDLQDWFSHLPLRPGRWLMRITRIARLFLASVVMVAGIGSIAIPQRTVVARMGPISGPDAPPAVFALLVRATVFSKLVQRLP